MTPEADSSYKEITMTTKTRKIGDKFEANVSDATCTVYGPEADTEAEALLALESYLYRMASSVSTALCAKAATS